MHIHIISLFPEVFSAITESGITRRAHQQGRYTLNFWCPREFTEDLHRTVDDRPYGGGPGMVMKAEPLARAIEAAKKQQPEAAVIFLT
ncbi:MAG: tRNA (guanosine(37)-N1)-methyltransferase TrmD, partial [Arenicellales bacterium]|nr:tRNA (guanosine(37)-N1)-methyltransferase TrmD [Arenicellales bacterium]